MTRRHLFSREVDRDDADPDPAPDPDSEPADAHIGPLDVDDDARYLSPFDPRRLDVERRTGKTFG